ncbi:hypothetical protein CRG98_009915 [Punica granatum]|uniref:Uncharacterized protein n=1 Tax=Punica granatum TaxID=22663 RepID=A0A2I0KMS2_PUNGR|nr:hypothetical protein CRG98_009915 [Punica granatum]
MVSLYCNCFYAHKPELAVRRIEAIGYQMYDGRPRFDNHLEAIEFIYKDFWSEIFKISEHNSLVFPPILQLTLGFFLTVAIITRDDQLPLSQASSTVATYLGPP